MNLDAVAVFVHRVTGGGFPAALVRELVEGIVAGPHCVHVVGPEDAPRAVGLLVDTCDNASNCAELDVFVDPQTDVPARTAQLLEWGAALAARGPRTCVEVPLHPGGPDEATVRAVGYAYAQTLWGMRAVPLPGPPAHPPLPSGFNWRELTPDLVPACHETTRLAFAQVPGAFVPTLEVFTARCADRTGGPRRILTDGHRVAAFSRAAWRTGTDGAVIGTVVSLGRHPDFKGQGLGPAALAEALRLLAAAGATSAELDVAARNTAALSLYERAGFVQETELRVFWK